MGQVAWQLLLSTLSESDRRLSAHLLESKGEQELH